jgi:hypothetical protein
MNMCFVTWGTIWAPAAPVNLRAKHGEQSITPFPLCSLSSPYSLAMWLHSTRGARAERAREGVEETGNGVVMEEVGEASDGACSLEAQRGDRWRGRACRLDKEAKACLMRRSWRQADQQQCAHGGG